MISVPFEKSFVKNSQLKSNSFYEQRTVARNTELTQLKKEIS